MSDVIVKSQSSCRYSVATWDHFSPDRSREGMCLWVSGCGAVLFCMLPWLWTSSRTSTQMALRWQSGKQQSYLGSRKRLKSKKQNKVPKKNPRGAKGASSNKAKQLEKMGSTSSTSNTCGAGTSSTCGTGTSSTCGTGTAGCVV